jgi:hypothetical protein
MLDADLGWHLLLTTTGTESLRTIRIGPAVDLPDEIHPVYGTDALALARATAAIDSAAHYIDDVTVTCPLGLGAGLGDVVSVPVDDAAVVGQVESITWTATPDGAIEQAVIRRHVTIEPEEYEEPIPPTPPTVVADAAATDAATTISGNVLDNDDEGLVVVAVNGLGGNVGTAVAGTSGGIFTVSADGSWSFDPASEFNEITEDTDTAVTYYASDGTAEASTTLTVTVSPVASTWHPSSLFGNDESGGVWDFTDRSTMWTDVAGTTPVSSDGDPIMRIDDISGTGLNLTSATAANALKYRPETPCAESTGAHYIYADIPALAYPFSMGLAGNAVGYTGDSRAGMSVAKPSATNMGAFVLGYNSAFSTGPVQAVYNTTWNARSCGSEIDGAFVGVGTFKAGDQHMMDDLDATSQSMSIACPSGLTRLAISAFARSTLVSYQGKYFCALLIDRELTSQERADFVSWAAAKAGLT